MNIVLESVKLKEEELLCYSQTNEPIELGCIGHLRGDFGSSGKEFNVTWFDHANKDKNDSYFKAVFDEIIDEFRANKGLLLDRVGMFNYCCEHPDCRNTHSYTDQCWEFRVLTNDHAFYIRCTPAVGDYNLYVYAYDKDMLMNRLSQERGLPRYCYSYLPTTREEIRIDFAENGYCPYRKITSDRSAKEMNRELGVMPAQAEAMLCGSMFGWNTSGTDPKNYDEKGKLLPKSKSDREAR